MLVIYTVEMEVEPSEHTDLVSIMDHLAEAIERAREERVLTDWNDFDTVIGNIGLYYNDEDQLEETLLWEETKT